ncbi:MAG TPA: HAD-IA family hydrolase [bacterium]|nr:HAD-IA family hydrolase [bacterium]
MANVNYHAVLFDLDGTLVDSGRDIIDSIRFTLDQVFPGRNKPSDEEILLMVGRPLESIVCELGYPVDDENTRRFVDTYRCYYAQHYNDSTKPYPGVEAMLQDLKSAGVKLGLVTTKHQTQAELTLAGLGLAGYFNDVYGWDEGRKHKPDPEPVRVSLSRIQVAPELALMVGDAELDIQSATAAGVDTCAVTYGFRPAWFLKSFNPCFLVARSADIVPIVISVGRDEPRFVA